MKIMLVSPAPVGALDDAPQLGLCYITSHLKKNGYQDVVYMNYFSFRDQDFIARLRKEKPDILGVNTYTPSRYDSYRACRFAKELLPNVKTMLGGVHVTFLPEQTIENYPEVDYVCFGEGEQTMLELVRCVERGEEPEGIPGVCFRKNGKAARNISRTDTPGLNDLSFPEYFDYYTKVDGKKLKSVSMITSRGCAAACNFCTVPAFWGRQRLRSPESVLAEMKWLVEEKGVRYIWFMDDTFTIEMDAARKLLEAIIESGLHQKIKWRCATRVNCVNRNLLDLMKKAGCHKISYGVESGSVEILKTVMKGTTLEQAKQACRQAKEAGIVVETNFMIGNPGETQATIDDTKAFIKEVKPDEFNVSNALYLFPGTPSYTMALRRNLIHDDIWLTDAQTVAYTAEHPQSQLSLWQLEVIHECSRQISWKNRLRYAWLIITRIKHKRLAGLVQQTLVTLIKKTFRMAKVKNEKESEMDIASLRTMLREESLKSRKPSQLQPVRHLSGLALKRFEKNSS